ncbi:hypothetical protein KC357_g187 [Hortaea werneckii]|nr:hypothetical protein KC357_g187 [Hortaea werneckii]
MIAFHVPRRRIVDGSPAFPVRRLLPASLDRAAAPPPSPSELEACPLRYSDSPCFDANVAGSESNAVTSENGIPFSLRGPFWGNSPVAFRITAFPAEAKICRIRGIWSASRALTRTIRARDSHQSRLGAGLGFAERLKSRRWSSSLMKASAVSPSPSTHQPRRFRPATHVDQALSVPAVVGDGEDGDKEDADAVGRFGFHARFLDQLGDGGFGEAAEEVEEAAGVSFFGCRGGVSICWVCEERKRLLVTYLCQIGSLVVFVDLAHDLVDFPPHPGPSSGVCEEQDTSDGLPRAARLSIPALAPLLWRLFVVPQELNFQQTAVSGMERAELAERAEQPVEVVVSTAVLPAASLLRQPPPLPFDLLLPSPAQPSVQSFPALHAVSGLLRAAIALLSRALGLPAACALPLSASPLLTLAFALRSLLRQASCALPRVSAFLPPPAFDSRVLSRSEAVLSPARLTGELSHDAATPLLELAGHHPIEVVPQLAGGTVCRAFSVRAVVAICGAIPGSIATVSRSIRSGFIMSGASRAAPTHLAPGTSLGPSVVDPKGNHPHPRLSMRSVLLQGMALNDEAYWQCRPLQTLCAPTVQPILMGPLEFRGQK